jgi:uncharacterized membrane protein
MCLLALGGMGAAGYLTYTHLANQAIVCGESLGCDIVAQSVYSQIAGVPIALLGLLAYIALFVLTMARGRVPEDLNAHIPLAVFGISLIGVLFSAYLTYLELFVILAVCKWCVGSAVIMTVFFLLSVFEVGAASSQPGPAGVSFNDSRGEQA